MANGGRRERKTPKEFRLETVNKFRTSLGMRPIEEGYRDCLICKKPFFSYDKKQNQLCISCSGIVTRKA
jgi:hypothetical protein